MNNIIKAQLERCSVADIPPINDDLQHFVVKKKVRLTASDLQVNHYYILELADYILNEPEGFTLSSNWNKGVVPKSKHLKCCITKRMGKMVFVEGIGFDLDTKTDNSDSFNGWLPAAGIKVIGEL